MDEWMPCCTPPRENTLAWWRSSESSNCVCVCVCVFPTIAEYVRRFTFLLFKNNDENKNNNNNNYKKEQKTKPILNERK